MLKFMVVLYRRPIGRASYEPGWKWSQHVGPLAGTALCEVEHVGLVMSGRAMAAMSDGAEIELAPGSLFYLPPLPTIVG